MHMALLLLLLLLLGPQGSQRCSVAALPDRVVLGLAGKAACVLGAARYLACEGVDAASTAAADTTTPVAAPASATAAAATAPAATAPAATAAVATPTPPAAAATPAPAAAAAGAVPATSAAAAAAATCPGSAGTWSPALGARGFPYHRLHCCQTFLPPLHATAGIEWDTDVEQPSRAAPRGPAAWLPRLVMLGANRAVTLYARS
jgi:hypothetical protein